MGGGDPARINRAHLTVFVSPRAISTPTHTSGCGSALYSFKSFLLSPRLFTVRRLSIIRLNLSYRFYPLEREISRMILDGDLVANRLGSLSLH